MRLRIFIDRRTALTAAKFFGLSDHTNSTCDGNRHFADLLSYEHGEINDPTDEKLTRVTICMPTEIAAATQKAAAKEFTTVSHVCRQAIVHDLRKRGWLSDPEAVGQPQN